MNGLKALFIAALAANAALVQAQVPEDFEKASAASQPVRADSAERTASPGWVVSGMAEAFGRFQPRERTTLGIPRFAVGAEFRPGKRWTLTGEIEFTTDNADRPYSLELIAAYEVSPALQIQAGYLPVPVGLFNRDDHPANRFAVAEPEGETAILPSGWTDGGAGIFGEFGKNRTQFSYSALAILPLLESKHRAAPGYAARLDWLGIEGLRLGGSVYFQPKAVTGAAKNGTANCTYWSLDAEYDGRIVVARACALGEHIGRSGLLSRNFSGEAGLKIKELTAKEKTPDLTPFVRYEYYQAPTDADGGDFTRIPTSVATVGVNYSPLSWMLVKADYAARVRHSGPKTCDHEVAIGLVLTGDIWKK